LSNACGYDLEPFELNILIFVICTCLGSRVSVSDTVKVSLTHEVRTMALRVNHLLALGSMCLLPALATNIRLG